MKKKGLLVILAILIVLSSLSVSAFAAVTSGNANSEGTATWSFDDETGVLTVSGTDYIDNDSDWVAPNREKIKSIIIEDGITEISSSTFENCTNLETVTIADSVSYLGGYAFANCTKLTSVTLPKNLVSYTWVFVDCTSLTDVTISEDNEYFKTVDGVLYNKKMTELYLYPSAKAGKSFTIPATVKHIDDEAFYNCDALETVVLPKSVTELSYYAFAECDNLKEIDISNVTELGSGVFSNCDSLKSVKFNKEVKIIDYSLFYDCDALESVDMSGLNLNDIGYDAFTSCDSLVDIKIPDSIQYFTAQAFEETGYAKDASNWENGILYFGEYAVMLSEEVAGVVTIKDGTIAVADDFAYQNSNITEVKFPSGLKRIGGWAFLDCSALDNIVIPDSVDYIGKDAFFNTKCFSDIAALDDNAVYIGKWLLSVKEDSELTEFTVKDGTAYIANGAAEYNEYLKKVTIPSSVKGICNYAFAQCYALETVNLSDNLETIGSYAFGYCENLKELELPSTLKKIGTSAFNYCYLLEDVTLPDGLEYIGSDAFNDCESFTEISVPDSVTYIGTSAFEDCVNIVSAKLPKGLKEIPDDTFKDCYELKNIILPDAFTAIGDEAFEDTAIESITLPYTLKSIENDAFYDCDELKKVIFLGIQKEWDNIDIDDEDNEALFNAELIVTALDDTSEKFADVKKNAWYKEYVDYAVNRNLFNGTSDTAFEPDKSMTRGMFVTVLSRVAGAVVDNSATTKFTDVPANKFYTGAVAWAVENEIVLGVSDTEFAPNKDVTREQMCTLLVRYATFAGVELQENVEKITFADADKISNYAKQAVEICQKAGIVNGKTATEFAPKESATRAQVAKILTVFLCGDLKDSINATAATEIKAEHETLIGTAARYDGVTFMTGDSIK